MHARIFDTRTQFFLRVLNLKHAFELNPFQNIYAHRYSLTVFAAFLFFLIVTSFLFIRFVMPFTNANTEVEVEACAKEPTNATTIPIAKR